MKKNLGPRIFLGLIVVAALAALGFSWRSPFSRAVQSGRPIFGLLVGTDWVDNARHADTIILVRYDPARRWLDLLSIPRDTRVNLPGLKVRRINEVYAYAFRSGKRNHDSACRELAQAVGWLLFSSSGSVSAPAIDFYGQIDYDGFKKIIDLLGGVGVTVDEPMHYDDNWGKLHIHFEPGTYQLNGQKALEFVRFRDSQGDFGRVFRQQEFLLKVLSRFKDPVNLARLPKILGASMRAVQTNLSAFDRLVILWELKGLDRNHMRLMQLPGRAQSGFWIPDLEGVAATGALLASGKRSVSDLAAPAVKPDARGAPARPKTTVEVWNASGKKGLALEVVRKLRLAGFDVVKWGNYSSIQQRTLVRDHKGATAEARRIVEALGSLRTEVFTRVEPDPLVDVEVILGQDYVR